MKNGNKYWLRCSLVGLVLTGVWLSLSPKDLMRSMFGKHEIFHASTDVGRTETIEPTPINVPTEPKQFESREPVSTTKSLFSNRAGRESCALKVRVVSTITDSRHSQSERPNSIKGARVTAYANLQDLEPITSSTTSEDGTAFLNLPIADCVVEISADGWATHRAELTRWEGTKSLTFSLLPGARFIGRVLGYRGSGLADVTVTVVDSFPPELPGVPSVKTDLDGGFSFDGLVAERPFMVLIVGDGYSTLKTGPFRIPWGEVLDEAFVLQAGCRVSGVLLWSDGTAIANSEILLRPLDVRLNAEWPAADTDKEGRFVFNDVLAGRWAVSSRPDHHPLLEHEITYLRPGDQIENLTLLRQRGLSISGRMILAPSSIPKSGISPSYEPRYRLRLTDPQNDVLEEVTTAKGEFEFHGLEVGEYNLTLAESEDKVYAAPIQVRSGDRDIVFEYHIASASLSFKVFDEGVLANGDVAIVVRDDSGTQRGDAHWLGDDWTFTTLPPHTPLSITITKKGCEAFVLNDFRLGVGERRLIEAQLQRIAPLEGKLLDSSDMPVVGAILTMDSKDFGQVHYAFAKTDDLGQFNMAAPGIEGVLTIRHPTQPAGMRLDVRPGLDEPITIRLPRGCLIRGKVLDQNGEGRGGLSVHAVFPGTSLEAARIRSDADGTFELPRLVPGRWELVVYFQFDGRELDRRSVTVSDGEVMTLQEPFVIY